MQHNISIIGIVVLVAQLVVFAWGAPTSLGRIDSISTPDLTDFTQSANDTPSTSHTPTFLSTNQNVLTHRPDTPHSAAANVIRQRKPRRKMIVPVDEEVSKWSPWELISKRPQRIRGKRLDWWRKAFDNHPIVAGLDVNKEAKALETDLREVRGSIRDEHIDRQMTLAIKRNLAIRSVPSSKINAVVRIWIEYLSALRVGKYTTKLKDPKDEEGKVRLQLYKEKHVARSRKQRERKKSSDMTRDETRSRLVEELKIKLTSSPKRIRLNMTQMEAATRAVLDKEPDSRLAREALTVYLVQQGHPQDFIDSVIALRKDVRQRKRRYEQTHTVEGAYTLSGRSKKQKDNEKGKAMTTFPVHQEIDSQHSTSEPYTQATLTTTYTNHDLDQIPSSLDDSKWWEQWTDW